MKLQKNPLSTKIFLLLIKFSSWIQNIPNKITPAPFRLIQISSAFWQSRALYIATKIGIADTVGDSCWKIPDLANTLEVNEERLYRLMRMLSSIGIFQEVRHYEFINSKLSTYLQEDHSKSVKNMILMHNSPEMCKPWYESLEQAIRTNTVPFKMIHGTDLFEYMDQNKDFNTLFSDAMKCVENITGTHFLDDIDWGKFDRLLDIGGSSGSKSLYILNAHPELKAIVYDRAEIINETKEKLQDTLNKTVKSRLKFVSGNFFESIPESISDKDVYFFMAIFHGFDDTQCLQILHNLKKAIGSKRPYIVIADSVAKETNIDSMTASMDMQMLVGTQGKERTLGEWRQLLDKGGFTIEQILDTRSLVKYLIARCI